MPATRDQHDRLGQDVLRDIYTKLERLDVALRGNGKPGVQVRLDRLETAQATRSRLLWIIAGSLVVLVVNAVWARLAGG